jgi:hypothetical protein
MTILATAILHLPARFIAKPEGPAKAPGANVLGVCRVCGFFCLSALGPYAKKTD